MHVRLSIVIILVAWIGPWGPIVPDLLVVASASWEETWLLGENLADLIAYQARRQIPWPSSGSCSRGRGRRRKKSASPD